MARKRRYSDEQHLGLNEAIAKEGARIQQVYVKRSAKIGRDPGIFGHRDFAHVVRVEERLREIIRLFSQQGLKSLEHCRILDIGCGSGDLLNHFIQWGARPEELHGVDLRASVIEEARLRYPHLSLRVGDGARLEYDDGLFDLVCQQTVFSSILSDSVRQAVAVEIDRVLAVGGYLLWYDLACNNPRNRNVSAVGRREIGHLFPGYEAVFRRISLAPPLARVVLRVSTAGYYLLSGLGPLCSHYLVLLRKPTPR